MHGLVCAVKHVVTKQVSCRHVYVQSCVMPSESSPTLCLLVLFANGSPMYSVHKLQPASNSRMLWDICSWNI